MQLGGGGTTGCSYSVGFEQLRLTGGGGSSKGSVHTALMHKGPAKTQESGVLV